MIFALPWALLGLLSLPAIWWLHRRLARPPRVDLPSLLFFVEEPGPVLATARRRRDLELALALLAAAGLSVAAASPEFSTGAHGRLVRVVVSGGAPGEQAGYEKRVQEAILRIRQATSSADEVEVVRGNASSSGPRPSPSALAAEARAGNPGLAVVVSDVVPEDLPPDVRWVAVGDPAVTNVGIVGADLEPAPEGFRLLVTLLNHARVPRAIAVDVGQDRIPLSLGPDEVRSVVHPVPGTSPEGEVSIHFAEPSTGDALPADDRVRFRRDAPRWGVDELLPRAQLEAAMAALAGVQGATAPASPGPSSAARSWLTVLSHGVWPTPGPVMGTPEAEPPLRARGILLGAVPEGEAGIRVPPGIDRFAPDPVTADLSLAGLDLVYAERPPEWILGSNGRFFPLGLTALITREVEGRHWPVLVRANGTLWLFPDIHRGSRPLISTPFWPLLVENIVRGVHGTEGVAGALREGLLDPASTRLGREARPFDPDWLLAASADRGPQPRRLAPWFAGLAVAALLALWIVGARLAPARAAGTQRLATAG